MKLQTTVKSLLSRQQVQNESRTTCGGFEWIPSGVNLCRKLVLIVFRLDSVLVISRELSDIPEASMSNVCGEVVSSASNNCLDDVCEKSSPLIVDLSENAENKGFFHVENEQHSSEVRIRKLTEKGQSYQNDIKLNSFKNKRSSFTGTLRKTLLFRGNCVTNYQSGSKSLVRHRFCGMNLWMHIMTFWKQFKTMS